MLKIFLKTFLYKLAWLIGFPKVMPINYTVSLLYACNSRCKTCNIWKKHTATLKAEDYAKIFKNIGKSPYWITLSGGEPFLRKDIVDICKAIYNASQPAIINIPTNGLLTNTVIENTKKIALACPKSQITINVSMDAYGKQHDEIRGVKDNFEKTLKTFTGLKRLNLKNLQVGIHTVISKFNVDNFASIATSLMELKPDSYITEIAENRVELATINEDISPNLISYKSAVDFLIHRIKHSKFKGMSKITQAFRIEYYNLVKKILRDEKQIIPCYSGLASVQISPAGDVWTCCIKAESFGNLVQNNYNFKKIWFSKEFKHERRKVKAGLCHCPLANSAYTNMLMNYPVLIRVFWRSFIKWWR